jgi:altronate dehydratase small subunit
MKHRAAVLVFSKKDNVGTAAAELHPGDSFQVSGRTGQELKAQEEIPFGFKVALSDIPAGSNVVKYGEVIGRSTCPIRAGEMVHIHNIEGIRGRGDLRSDP